MYVYVYLFLDREERLWHTTINLWTDNIFIIFGVVFSQQSLFAVSKQLKLGLYHAWLFTVSLCSFVVFLQDLDSDWNQCCLTFQQYCDNKISKYLTIM